MNLKHFWCNYIHTSIIAFFLLVLPGRAAAVGGDVCFPLPLLFPFSADNNDMSSDALEYFKHQIKRK